MNQNMSYTNKISFPLQPNTVHRLKVPTIFPSYHASISDVLYGNGLIHYSLKLDDVKYPMIQNIGPYKHCLICAQSLSSELFHCNSESHINNTKNRQTQLLLRKYHNVFVHLPIEYQIQQKYFRKEEQLRCILCCVSIPYDSKLILGHVQLPQHNSKQERFEAEPSTSRDSSPNIKQKIETPIKKSSPTKSRSEGGSKTNSPKNAETEINFENGISDLTDPTTTNNKSRNNKQQQSASSIQSPKKSSPKKTPHHQTTLEYSSAAKDKLFKDLEEYIATIDGNNYFIFRHSMLDIRCILCNDGPVNNLSDHIKTGNHIKRMETESALRVLEKFHNMWMIDSKLQEHQFYIIQKHCHKCHVTSHGKNIISHVLSKEHIKNVDDETKEENSEIPNETHVSYDANKSDAAALESENNVSDGGSKRDHVVLENDQIHGESLETTEISLNYALWVKDSLYNGLSQYTVTVDSIKYPYLRRTCRGLRCILCKDAAVHNITDHINKEVHVKLMGTSVACKEVQSFHNIWLRFCPHDQSQQIYFINGRCILCCLKNGLYDDIDEHLAYKGHRITEGYETVEELHEQMGIGDKFQYCEEAQAAFYEGLNDYYAFYGIIKLPLLRVTTEGTRCILCDDAGVASPKQHVGTPGHKQAEYDTQRLEKLWKFHKMWQRMTPRAQMHQQYVILTMCIACDKKLSVDTAEAHVLSKMHKGNVKLKQQKTAKPTNTKKHDVKESAIDPKSQHMLSQLPSYLSYHLKALTSDVKNHDKVKCTFCNKVFTRLFELRKHLDSVAHCKELKVHQFEGNFFCEICVLSYPNDALWLEHLSNAKHVDRVSKLGDSRKANMKEHTCNTCRMIIFGDAISLLRHGRDKTDNETKLSLTKGLKELLSSRKHITDVADELLKLSESEMEESEANVEKCCLALEKALWSEYPNCHAYPFGSRVTGLGNNNSDLDVFIDIGGVYGGSEFQSATEQADIVSSVGTLLEKQRKHFCHINKICGARTPIVQVLHSDTEIDCDISFRHGLSVENTELIKYCLELQPIAKPTMLVLKDWLVKSELPYGSITSYAFTLLFIFFMQRENYLLPIADIRKINKSKGPFIDGWEAIKYSKTPMEMKSYIITCQLSIPELLEMFFTYYSNFDFNSLVICPLIGRTLSKFHFHPRKPNLPVEMATYIQKLNSSANPEQFRNRTPMGVQDPFDLSHNVTKGCSDICTKMFKKFCRLSKSQISALK